MNDEKELQKRFIDHYQQLVTMKPPCLLAKGRDNHYYWIYYAGMGSVSLQLIEGWALQALEMLHQSGAVKNTYETVTLPLYHKNGVRSAIVELYEIDTDRKQA